MVGAKVEKKVEVVEQRNQTVEAEETLMREVEYHWSDPDWKTEGLNLLGSLVEQH